jgi:hypothetical protein
MMTMARRGHREKLKGGDEWDWICGTWRRLMTYTGRPGVGKWIKNKMNRRARREGKRDAEMQRKDL